MWRRSNRRFQIEGMAFSTLFTGRLVSFAVPPLTTMASFRYSIVRPGSALLYDCVQSSRIAMANTILFPMGEMLNFVSFNRLQHHGSDKLN